MYEERVALNLGSSRNDFFFLHATCQFLLSSYNSLILFIKHSPTLQFWQQLKKTN